MNEPTITCPKCHADIRLTESLAAPLIEATREKFRQHLQSEMAKVKDREAAIQQQMRSIAEEREQLNARIEERLASERSKIVAEESARARLLLETDLKKRDADLLNLEAALQDRTAKLEAAQKAEADFLRQKRDLDDARRELSLTVEKRVGEQLQAERDRGKREAEETLQLKVREKDEQIASMQRRIEELKRQSEQGSQQLQGEAFEVQLEDTLKRHFPTDIIEPVAKGEFGGDIVQTVVGASGAVAGTILWEVKRTRTWSDAWLGKLRSDQRAVNADIALIVSQTLPKGCDTFDLKDGVWVTSPPCFLPVSIALREQLLCVAGARRAGEGQLTKTELVYAYLTGPRFRHRVEAIVEQFNEMQGDLDRERKVFTKQWAKREQQIRCVLESTAGMYGDLQGIAGQSIKEVEGLSLALLEGPEE